MDDSFLTKTAVLSRPGWSQKLVTVFLGEPDQRKKLFGSNTILALYAVPRVEAAEGSAEFLDAQVELSKRKAAAKKAVATKTARLMESILAMPIAVRQLKLKRVREQAIASYNSRGNGYAFASPADDPAFLDRITVNFIRHELTEYHRALWDAAGKTGVRQAITLIRKRIYGAIAEAYPMLASECARQNMERSVTAFG